MRRKTAAAVGLLLLAGAIPALAERKFVATDVANASIKQPGRILITNDRHSIVAWHFHGYVRTSIVRIRASATSIPMTPFGPVLFESSADVPSFVPSEIAEVIREASTRSGVDPRLVSTIAWRESRFNRTAVSKAGAQGIMQLMPETAKWMGVDDVFDAKQNVSGGVRYLKILLDTFRGDLNLVLAAYNAGPGAVERYRGVPPYRETRDYVAGVRTHYESVIR